MATTTPTPHNAANPGDIAKTVLMPGDPLRAKFIAETYLENPVCFNTVRNMLGYTGTYQGKRVSVMGSGMGMPSIGIYSYELYHFYNVETIIRWGNRGPRTCARRRDWDWRVYGFQLWLAIPPAGCVCTHWRFYACAEGGAVCAET